MPNEDSVPFDLAQAHRHFAADCFNRTWKLMEKQNRTSMEDEEMVLCAMTSLWHWMQREDVTDRNLSVGHWQASRAFALIGQGENALRHGNLAVTYAAGASAFYQGYAHEAVARAAGVLDDVQMFRSHLQKAQTFAAMVTDEDERSSLEADLRTLAVGGLKK